MADDCWPPDTLIERPDSLARWLRARAMTCRVPSARLKPSDAAVKRTFFLAVNTGQRLERAGEARVRAP